MSAFPNSGRSAPWESAILTGSFRPQADISSARNLQSRNYYERKYHQNNYNEDLAHIA